jgi:hypothetical protein
MQPAAVFMRFQIGLPPPLDFAGVAAQSQRHARRQAAE